MVSNHAVPERLRVLPPLLGEDRPMIKSGTVLRCRAVDRSNGAVVLLDLGGECCRALLALIQSAGWWFIHPIDGADLLHVCKDDGACAFYLARPTPILTRPDSENFMTDPHRNSLVDVAGITVLVGKMRGLPMLP